MTERFMHTDASIFLAWHHGLVGSAILRALDRFGYEKIVTRDRTILNLEDKGAVEEFSKEVRPDFVILAGAKV